MQSCGKDFVATVWRMFRNFYGTRWRHRSHNGFNPFDSCVRALIFYLVHSMNNQPTIGVMGAGMVGGSTIRYFESSGHAVVIYDPFKGHTDASVLGGADYIFICVPTPYDEEKGGFDLSFVRDAMRLRSE